VVTLKHRLLYVQYPLYSRLDEPHRWFGLGGEEKIFPAFAENQTQVSNP